MPRTISGFITPVSQAHNESAVPPVLFTVDEVASLLRTTRRAIYAMAERGALPGLTRLGRRVLFRREDVLRWLEEKREISATG